MKVLFDTNIILDAVLARVPFVENAAYLLEAVELGKIQDSRVYLGYDCYRYSLSSKASY